MNQTSGATLFGGLNSDERSNIRYVEHILRVLAIQCVMCRVSLSPLLSRSFFIILHVRSSMVRLLHTKEK